MNASGAPSTRFDPRLRDVSMPLQERWDQGRLYFEASHMYNRKTHKQRFIQKEPTSQKD